MPKRKPREKWAICLGCRMDPCTWGKIRHMNSHCVTITYGKDAPWWPSDLWQREHVKVVYSEKAARKAVEDYEAKQVYDPR